MTTIIVETRIDAPITVCFDLARSLDAHVTTSAATRERIVGGRTTGLLELGDVVTFEAVHFGIRQRLTSTVVQLDRPTYFVDEMVKGAFSSLRHLHEFSSEGTHTLMRDTLTWRAPFGILGIMADKTFVQRHMRNFMIAKQAELKREAEWRTAAVESAAPL